MSAFAFYFFLPFFCFFFLRLPPLFFLVLILLLLFFPRLLLLLLSLSLSLSLARADAAAMFALNEAIRAGDASNTLKALKDPHTHVTPVVDKCKDRYQDALGIALKNKVGLCVCVEVFLPLFTCDECGLLILALFFLSHAFLFSPS